MTARYLPSQLADELNRKMPKELSDSEAWTLTRYAELVYAQGYNDGHQRGYTEGYDDRKRPNQNAINELRERMKEEGLFPKDGGS